MLDEFKAEHRVFPYNSQLSPATSPERTMEKTLQAVKESGYIIAPFSFQQIYLSWKYRRWLKSHTIEVSRTETICGYSWGTATDDPALLHLLGGSLFPTPLEGVNLNPDDPFFLAWKSQGAEAVARLNAANPIQRGQNDTEISGPGFKRTKETPGYVFAEDDFFVKQLFPVFGSGFLYDAVIATGMGSCRVASKSNGSVLWKSTIS